MWFGYIVQNKRVFHILQVYKGCKGFVNRHIIDVYATTCMKKWDSIIMHMPADDTRTAISDCTNQRRRTNLALYSIKFTLTYLSYYMFSSSTSFPNFAGSCLWNKLQQKSTCRIRRFLEGLQALLITWQPKQWNGVSRFLKESDHAKQLMVDEIVQFMSCITWNVLVCCVLLAETDAAFNCIYCLGEFKDEELNDVLICSICSEKSHESLHSIWRDQQWWRIVAEIYPFEKIPKLGEVQSFCTQGVFGGISKGKSAIMRRIWSLKSSRDRCL